LIYRFGGFEVDDVAFRLSENGKAVALEPKALRLLIYLVENSGRLVRKKELLDSVWQDANVGDNALTRSVALLRKALGDDSREPRFIETVPTAGYRFLAAIETPPTKAQEALDETAGASRTEANPNIARLIAPATVTGKNFRWTWLRSTILLGSVVVVAGLVWSLERPLHTSQVIHSIAVLPLENLSGNPAQEYLADGTTDELITELARIPNLRVVSRSSAMQEKGSHKSLREIADELKADAVVEGSVVFSGDRVRINAKLVDTHGDSHLWSSSFEGKAGDIVSLEDDVAREVAVHARLATLPASDKNSIHAVPAQAHDAYLRGLYYYDQRSAEKSAESFQRAVELDPAYSSAYAGLATALVSETLLLGKSPTETEPRATAAAHRAIELDPGNGEAYIALGTVEQTLRWDWNAAEHDLQRGLELSPDNATGLMTYALHRVSMGDPEGAIAYIRRARDNDPLSFFTARQYGSILFYARHYDEALLQLQHLQAAQPNAKNVIENWLSWIYEKKGMRDQAVAHDLLFLARNRPEADVASLREEYKREGWKGYWQMRLKALHAAASGCVLYDQGVMYERSGDNVRALSALDEAARQRCFWMTTARVDPLLDDLRGDPRFNGILRSANLGTIGQSR
jgi:TolB-like protein/DNA-binding winged helix-turn-helix (wHTH) protein/cytochrome c-type biogenesis protein CcmH/NrfG